MKHTLCAIALILPLLVHCSDVHAQRPTPGATATPKPKPDKPTFCASKEHSGFGSVPANDGFKDLACDDARKDLEKKPALACDSGCIPFSRSQVVHGFTNSFVDGVINEALDFMFEEECRITETLKCVKK